MHVRAISTACLALLLVSLGCACDKKADDPVDAKGTKADEKKADEKKADEKKADEKEADEKKADEKKADDGKVDDGKVDDGKVDDGKVDEGKTDEGKTDTKKPDEKTTGDTKKVTPPPSGANGKELFEKKCKTCHGATGNADTKLGKENDIPDWTKAGWKAKWTEAKVVVIVTNGKSDTKMKPFKDKLTADEIAAVSKYARALGK